MQTFPAAADRTVTDLRYASVHGPARRDPGPRPSAGLGVGALTGLLFVGVAAAFLAGCARDAEPRTFAVPSAAAARIRMVCPPGSFLGAMTVNCPQILPDAR